jgi:propanol-preferring alcohol dehydrogenase
MRALVLERPGPLGGTPGPLEIRDVPDPEPGPGELLLRVSACAVCRTDLQLAEGDLPPRRRPSIPGHQVVGRVLGIGPEVGGWSVGERAAVGWLAGTCGACAACAAGRENLCESAMFTGWDRDGGFADRMLARADFALRVPDGFDDLAAAPLLCGGVIGYRALLVSGIRPGGHLGLYGFGSSASLAIQVARHWGCEVHVATRSPRERDRALRLGAASVGGYDEPPSSPLDAAVTFAPAGSVVVAALRAVGRGGTVAINAIHLDGIPAFPYDDLWWERGLRSVANCTRGDARDFLDLAAGIPVRTAVEVLPLEEGAGALRGLSEGTLEGTAVLVPRLPAAGISPGA